MTMIGTLSSIPHTPHSQPQNSSPMKIAAEFMLAILPIIQVVTKVPTRVAMASGRRGDEERGRDRVELHERRHAGCGSGHAPAQGRE